MKLAKFLSIAFLSMPLVAQADLTVRERNFIIGGIILGALGSNSIQSPTYMSGHVVPQIVPVNPVPHCRLRQSITGLVQQCSLYGVQSVYPATQHYGYPTIVVPNVQIVYQRY